MLIVGSLLLIGFSFILVCHSVTTAAYERSVRKAEPETEPAPVTHRNTPAEELTTISAPIRGFRPRLVWHNDGSTG
jgi:hypothetical protein